MDASDPQIYFRIGLKGANPTTAPRYGMVLLIYADNTKMQRIFIRQGEEPDYLMRPDDAVSTGGIAVRDKAAKIVPYNLTAQTLNAMADSALTFPAVNSGIFTEYPTQAGAYFQWANSSTGATRKTRWAWPPTGAISGWNTTTPTTYWDDLSVIHETCPFRYRRFTDGKTDAADAGPTISLSELRQSLFLQPQAGPYAYSSGNFTHGYYADGFFDRRQLGNSENSVANSTVASSTPEVAYRGTLFYNPDNNASLFFPAAGSRSNSNGSANYFGNVTKYWSATSSATGTAFTLDGTVSSRNIIINTAVNRALATPVRCISYPMIKVVPVDYERSYLDPISSTWGRYDSYLMDGSTYTIKVHSNTPWVIKSITQEDKSFRTMFNPTPSHSTGSPKQILALQSGDNMRVGTGGTGLVTGETLTFTVVNDASFWGRVDITIGSPTGACDDVTVPLIFTLPRVRLLSVGTGVWAFTSSSKAYQMLIDHNNFGTDPDSSVVYSRGFTMTNIGSTRPTPFQLDSTDIFIPTYNYHDLGSDARTNFKNFITGGGVLISFLEDDVSYAAMETFLRDVVPNGSAITVPGEMGNGGAYLIDSVVNDVVNNGPFGNVRGLIWGEDEAGTLRVANLPTNGEVTVYSMADDLKSNRNYPGEVVMFKCNTVPLLFCGDGGYLAYASGSSNDRRPFRLDANNRPFTKNYGNFQAGKIPPGMSNPVVVHNAALFGNMMLWAISQVDYSRKVWNER
jgi:hypothetical protein